MKNIFRAYDIRGILNKEINPKNVEKIGKAFGTFLKKGNVVVARDVRNNGEILKESLIKGITSAGVNVIDIGLQCTPVLNFYCKYSNSTAGAQITASHNPPNYSGVRFRRGDGIGFPECIPSVKELFFSEKFSAPEKIGEIKKVDEEKAKQAYKDFLLDKIKIANNFSVVLDPGNGATSNFVKKLFENAGCKVLAINNQPNGNFPGRGPDPKPDKLLELGQKIMESNADMGLAFDGDGDRVVVVDNKGIPLSADETGCLIAEELLSKKKGTIAINVECSKAVEDAIIKKGGKVVYIRVGDAFLANAVKKHNAIFAMEASDHFLIPEYFPADDGVMTGLFFSKMMSEKNRPLSEIRKSVRMYPKQKIKLECDDEIKFKVIHNLREKLKKEYRIIDIDGIRVDMKKGWVLIRASNTSPYIRLTAEAEDEKESKLILNKFKTILENEIRKVKK